MRRLLAVALFGGVALGETVVVGEAARIVYLADEAGEPTSTVWLDVPGYLEASVSLDGFDTRFTLDRRWRRRVGPGDRVRYRAESSGPRRKRLRLRAGWRGVTLVRWRLRPKAIYGEPVRVTVQDVETGEYVEGAGVELRR